MGIYLNNAATSFPKPEKVYKAMDDYLRHIGVSAGRGAYKLALEADRVVYEARSHLGRLFNIKGLDCTAPLALTAVLAL